MSQSSIKRGDIISFPNISNTKWKVLSKPVTGITKIRSVKGNKERYRVVDIAAHFKPLGGIPTEADLKRYKIKKHDSTC